MFLSVCLCGVFSDGSRIELRSCWTLMKSLAGRCALRWSSVWGVQVGGPGAGKRSCELRILGRVVWVEVVRVVDVGGTTGSGAGSSCSSVHRKSAAVVFFCTAISYYVVCRPHVSQEIMSGVVCGC